MSSASSLGAGGAGGRGEACPLSPRRLRAKCREDGGKSARREPGTGRRRAAVREGGRARAPLFQQCGGVARTPASAAGRDLRQWGERRRRRWRRRRQLCGRLRPGLLDGGVAEAPPEAAGTWREAEEYVREGSVDSAGGNRHACCQEAEVEQRREQQPGSLGRRECECSPVCPGTVELQVSGSLETGLAGGRPWGQGKVSPRAQENAGVRGNPTCPRDSNCPGLRLPLASGKLAKERIKGPKFGEVCSDHPCGGGGVSLRL